MYIFREHLTRFCRWCALVALLIVPSASAQWLTQNLQLSPGWNAVWLYVAPTPSDCDSLFGVNPAIRSVRRWAPPPVDAVQHDQTTGTSLPLSGSWLTWFPVGHPDRALLNLAELAGGAAYLVEVSGASPVNLSLTGRPVKRSYEWQPGTHHFVGLPVFASTVSFSSFFAAAAPKILVDYRDGGEIYTVLPDGSHQRIFTPSATTINPAGAYWIKAQEFCTYSGPIEVKLESGADWMDFGRRLTPQYLQIRNLTGASRSIKIAHQPSGNPPVGTPQRAGMVPLKFAVVTALSEAQGRTWQNFPSLQPWTVDLAAGASVRLAFLPDALGLASGNTNAAYQSILEVTDDVTTPGVVRDRFGIRAMARSGLAAESRGLWVGEATITGVGRLDMPALYGSSMDVKPVPRPYNFRLLAHVDTNGTSRLLQSVYVGTRPDSTNGGVITDLLANERLLPAYKAQPGANVFRVSSANFPFMAPLQLNNGAFALPGQAVWGIVNMTNTDPVNPFLHAYSPLHDNQEARASGNVPYPEDMEVFSVSRKIEMFFEGPDQLNPEPRWGETVCGGTYKESIYGLGGTLDPSNRVIQVEGRFVMRRASPVPSLQQ